MLRAPRLIFRFAVCRAAAELRRFCLFCFAIMLFSPRATLMFHFAPPPCRHAPLHDTLPLLMPITLLLPGASGRYAAGFERRAMRCL